MNRNDYLRIAILEAQKVIGLVSPNPAVGAVLVKNKKIIGVGHTQPPGKNHAEIEAIQKVGLKAKGADLYVTLEPCCHIGRTGPCADAIIKAGIKKVFIGMKDPNPKVNGGGMKQLKKQGIMVEIISSQSKLAREIRLLNQPFIKAITTGLPYVIMKAAISLDGKIATRSGNSQWITGSEARTDARIERSLCDAVLVGAGTVAADDPELASQGIFKNKKLLRVIIDGQLSSDLNKKVFRDNNVLVACTDSASTIRCRAYDQAGINYVAFGKKIVDIKKFLKYLASQEIRSVYVEGGASVHGAFHDAALKDHRLIDRVIFYIAPKIIGGKNSLSSVGGKGVIELNEVLKLKRVKMENCGADFKCSGFLNFY